MFCDRCGAGVQPDQRFCGQCGKDFGAGTTNRYQPPNRVQQHIRLVGILWLAMSVLHALVGVIMLILADGIFAHLHELGAPPEVPTGFLHALFSAIGTFVLIKAAVGFAAGWGLLRREPWARILTIVLSFFALLNIPLGTALGIYSLWVLLPAQSEAEYEQAVHNTSAG